MKVGDRVKIVYKPECNWCSDDRDCYAFNGKIKYVANVYDHGLEFTDEEGIFWSIRCCNILPSKTMETE